MAGPTRPTGKGHFGAPSWSSIWLPREQGAGARRSSCSKRAGRRARSPATTRQAQLVLPPFPLGKGVCLIFSAACAGGAPDALPVAGLLAGG